MLWCLEKKTRTNQHQLRLRLKTAEQRACRGLVPHTLDLNAYYTFVWLAYAKTNGSFNLQVTLQGSTRSWTAQIGYQLYTCVYKDFHLQYLFSEQLGRRRPINFPIAQDEQQPQKLTFSWNSSKLHCRKMSGRRKLKSDFLTMYAYSDSWWCFN
jgi:hypothetical protein